MVWRRLRRTLEEPVDAASLAALRIAFGAIGALAALRFFTHGWVHKYWEAPRMFFPYAGLSWVEPWPAPWMHVHYAVMLVAALGVAFGIGTRVCCAVFAFTFSYAHLCDKTNYLNHYYLVSLLAFVGIFVPWDREASIRIWRRPHERASAPAWALWLLRLQIGVVYLFGGLGKLGEDWLRHGQPLRIWLAANAELPVFGRFFQLSETALLFSWAGMLFDVSIVGFLSWRRSRPWAYLVLVGFHVLTSMLFRIGMFPWMMIAFAPIFFEPSWPRRFFGRTPQLPLATSSSRPLSPFGVTLLVGYALVQLLVPLRSLLYPGNTLWSEEGFRFSWKVMLIEKSGDLELRVEDADGRRTFVEPRDYLTDVQLRMVVTQPDMILQLAHAVAAEETAKGRRGVRVYADSAVSFNGREHRAMIDPTRDLVKERDTFAPKTWISPAPEQPPAF